MLHDLEKNWFVEFALLQAVCDGLPITNKFNNCNVFVSLFFHCKLAHKEGFFTKQRMLKNAHYIRQSL